MRDVDSIKKSLNGLSGYIHDIDRCISEGLTCIWNNEDVVKAFISGAFSDTFRRYVLMVTDKNRLIVVYESEYEEKGFIFDRTKYCYEIKIVDLTGVDENKSRCLQCKTGGFFASIYYEIVFEGMQNKFSLYFNTEREANNVLDFVLRNAKKYADKQVEKTSNAGAGSNVAIVEIRKMFEDGLITKSEMLDLLKNVTNSNNI